MKIMPLLLMMMLVVVPCSANTDIYSVQFTDANGVFVGNTDIVKCTIALQGQDKTLITTYLVDLYQGTFKIIAVNGEKITGKNNTWDEMQTGMFNDISQYVKANYNSILAYSRENPQAAYRSN